MCHDHRDAIPYLIPKFHREKIHKKLYPKIKNHKQRDLNKRNVAASLKNKSGVKLLITACTIYPTKQAVILLLY